MIINFILIFYPLFFVIIYIIINISIDNLSYVYSRYLFFYYSIYK